MSGRFSLRRLNAVPVVLVALLFVLPAPANGGAIRSVDRDLLRYFLAQSPFDGIKLLAEGQSLVMQQTTQASTEAIAKFKEAFASFQKIDFKFGMSGARLWEGIAYDSIGKSKEALNAFVDSSRYLKESGFGFLDPIQQAIIGVTYGSQGEPEKAIDLLSNVLPTLREARVPRFLAFALKGLGDANVQIGKKHEALVDLNEALSLYREMGDWLHEVQVLPLISALKSSLGQSTEAMEFARAAVDRAKEKASADWEAYGYLAVGASFASAGNLSEAFKAYNQSLELLKRTRDDTGQATALNNLGLIEISRGDFDRALDYFEKALKLAKSGDDPKLAAYATNNIGTIYYRRGDPVKAFRYFEEALAVARLHNDKRLKAAVLSSMADAYFLTGSSELVLKTLKENADVFREIEEPAHESEILISLADAYGALGRHQEALDLLRRALKSRRMAGDTGREGYVLREMGHIYANAGDRDNALKHYSEALSKLEAAGDAIGQTDVYAAMGALSVSSGEYRKSEDQLTKGLALARTASLRQFEFLIVMLLGFAHEKQGELAQAEEFYDQAIALGESLRSSARIEELKTGVSNLSASLLAPAILLKFKLGKWSEAFALTERARARTFLDQMHSAHIDIRGGDPGLANQEQSLRFEMSSLEEKLRRERRENPRSEASALMATGLKEKEETYNTVLMRLKASNPNYAELQSYSPTSLNEIQRLLGPKITLISYFVTAQKTLAFVVGSDSLHVVDIPVKETDLRAAIDWFRGFASLRDPQPQSLKQLHDWLVAPIRQYIKTANVVIVPHGILNYVPFVALTDGRRYFGDDHAISYLPSASILQSLRHRIHGSRDRVLAVAQSRAAGLPSLQFVDEEAASVAKVYRTQPLLTSRATKAEFLKRASDYKVLHIAAHAELNAVSPLFSRIRLSPDDNDGGTIEVREIYGMDLAKTNLVVLSACETQLGALSKGDDIVGLNRAFIYAGASSVIASLWTVNDEATSLLMKEFYRHLKEGISKAAALKAAQAATRKKFPHPYYWAAFVLNGDPGEDRGESFAKGRSSVEGAKRFR